MSPCEVGSYKIEELYAKQVGGNPIVQQRGAKFHRERQSVKRQVLPDFNMWFT